MEPVEPSLNVIDPRTNAWVGAPATGSNSGQAVISNDLVRGLRTQASPSRTGQGWVERARKLGKRIGRPPVTERDGFAERFREVVERIKPGGLSHRQAGKDLGIGFATLKRLLDAYEPPAVATRTARRALLPSVAGRHMLQSEVTDKIAQL